MNSAQPRLTADDLKAQIDIVEFVRSYGVELIPDGAELRACCPFHQEKTPSFTVTPASRMYHCFGCGAGGSVIDFAMQWRGCSLHEALKECAEWLGPGAVPGAPAVQRESVATKKRSEWVPVIPVPDSAGDPPAEFVKRRDGQRVAHPVVARWPYRDADGGLIGYVSRIEFVKDDGTTGKDVLPCVFARNESTGRSEWRWLSFGKPRPLYGLPDLAARPGAQVLVVEGEKTRDAAQRLLPGLVVVTWPGGSKAISHVDWSPLEGRKVVLWPDRDPAGIAAMEGWIDQRHTLKPGVLQHLEPIAAGIRVVDPPSGDEDGWDLADGEASGWTTDDVMAHIRAAMRDPRSPVIDEPEPPANDNYPPADYYDMPPTGFDGYEGNDDDTPFRCLGFQPGPVFYYMPKGTQMVMALTPSSHTQLNLLALAPLSWWKRSCGGQATDKISAESWRMLADMLMQQNSRMKRFNPDRIRGRGAWWDDVKGKPAIHLGERVVIGDEVYDRLDKVPGRYIYELGNPLAVSMQNPLFAPESRELIKICEKLSWEKPVNGKLLAGWLMLAPICGALDWRPHIWITGPAGSGKSTVMSLIVNRAMGDMAMFVQSATTEAGLRQAIGSDAIPVVFDEAESESQARAAKIDEIMGLVTQASSDTGAKIVKGSASGTAMAYSVRSMFAFSSIGINIKQFAAKTRITTLGLVSQPPTADNQERYKDLLRLISDTITDDYVRRLHARAITMIPVIRKNAKTFAAAAGIQLGMTRLGDQVGTLLAGAYALHSDSEITRAAAEKFIAEQDWSEVAVVNDTTDEQKCLDRIKQSMIYVDTDRGRPQVMICEVMEAAAELTPMEGLDRDRAARVLRRYGLIVDGVGRDGNLLVANGHEQLRKLLADSPWAGAWRDALSRLKGATKVGQHRFGSGAKDSQRCVAIPLSVVFGDKE